MKRWFVLVAVLVSVVVFAQGGFCGLVDIVLRPASQAVHVGEEVAVGVYLVSQSQTNQPFIITEVDMTYDPGLIAYSSLNVDGAPYEWMISDFLVGAINDNLYDGDMKFSAWSYLGEPPPEATPSGLLAASIVFSAGTKPGHARIEVPALVGTAATRVFAADQANKDIKGRLLGTDILVAETGTSPSIANLKLSPDLAVRELQGPVVTRVISTENSFYLEDTSRATGIRVRCLQGQPMPTEGTAPTVFGVLRTVDQERVLDEAVVIPRTDTAEVRSLAVDPRVVGAAMGLRMTGLLVTVAGRVSVPTPSSTEFTIATGPGLLPLKVLLYGVSAPANNSVCVVTGCIGADASGQLVRVCHPGDIRVISGG